MKEDGRVQPVRRLLVSAQLGREVPKSVRLRVGCVSLFCVNPDHTIKRGIDEALGPKPAPPPSDDLEDAIYAVYQSAEPWSAAAIAARYDLEPETVERAIIEIREGRA